MNRALAHLITLGYMLRDRFDSKNERGATAVEYGLMVGLIAVAIIVTVGFLGGSLNDLFGLVESDLDALTP